MIWNENKSIKPFMRRVTLYTILKVLYTNIVAFNIEFIGFKCAKDKPH